MTGPANKKKLLYYLAVHAAENQSRTVEVFSVGIYHVSDLSDVL